MPRQIFELGYFQDNPAPFYTLCKELFPGQYAPTPTHYFLKLLHDKGRLLRVFSQNIDSLESTAGLEPDMIVAAHGNFDSAHCVQTGASIPIDELRDAVMAGETGWRAMNEKHGGLVKPDIVFFGESLPARFFALAQQDFPRCDMLVVIGTSLKVAPFCTLIDAVGKHVPRLLLNREAVSVVDEDEYMRSQTQGWPTNGFIFHRLGGYRDVFHAGNCDDSVRALADALGWRQDLEALVTKGNAEFHCRSSVHMPETDDPRPSQAGDSAALQAAENMVEALEKLDLVSPDLAAASAACSDSVAAAATAHDDGASTKAISTAAAALPLDQRTHVSGVFTGSAKPKKAAATEEEEEENKEKEEQEEQEEPLCWVLSLLSSGPSKGRAFGAGYRTTLDGAAVQYCLLEGSCRLEDGHVTLQARWEPISEFEADIDDDAPVFTGRLELLESGAVQLSGDWTQEVKEEAGDATVTKAGTFAVVMSPAKASDRISGTWLGSAAPEFDQGVVVSADTSGTVAVNPISWALSIGSEAVTPGGPRVFGAGFFDDAGDIPGNPLLFYILKDSNEDQGGEESMGATADAAAAAAAASASISSGVETMPTTMIKQYCAPVPRALRVLYTDLIIEHDVIKGTNIIKGRWSNLLEGTTGVFAAQHEPQ